MPVTIKLLYTCFSPAWGGLEKYAFELAVEERKRGRDLLFACQKDTRLEKELATAGIPHRSFKYRSHFDIPLMLKLREIIKEGRHIIHVHKSRDLRVLIPAGLGLRNAKLFYSLYMNVPGPKKDLYHRFIYKRIRRIFVSSAELQNSARQYLPVEKNQVRLLHYGLDTDVFAPGRAEDFRREMGFTPDNIVIGVLSRLDPQKGQIDAVRAMPYVLKRYPHARLLLVGDESFDYRGTEKKRIEGEIVKLGIQNAVLFLPYQEDAARTVNAMDIFLLPSHCETYSVSMIMAQLCAVPVAGTNTGGTPEQLGNGEYGVLVPPQAPKEIADGIMEILKDPEAAKQKAQRGRRIALERHSFSKMLERLEEEYAQAAGQPI